MKNFRLGRDYQLGDWVSAPVIVNENDVEWVNDRICRLELDDWECNGFDVGYAFVTKEHGIVGHGFNLKPIQLRVEHLLSNGFEYKDGLYVLSDKEGGWKIVLDDHGLNSCLWNMTVECFHKYETGGRYGHRVTVKENYIAVHHLQQAMRWCGIKRDFVI